MFSSILTLTNIKTGSQSGRTNDSVIDLTCGTPAPASKQTFFDRAKEMFAVTGPVRQKRAATEQPPDTRRAAAPALGAVRPLPPSPGAPIVQSEAPIQVKQEDSSDTLSLRSVTPAREDELCIVGVVKAEPGTPSLTMPPPATIPSRNKDMARQRSVSPSNRNRARSKTPAPLVHGMMRSPSVRALTPAGRQRSLTPSIRLQRGMSVSARGRQRSLSVVPRGRSVTPASTTSVVGSGATPGPSSQPQPQPRLPISMRTPTPAAQGIEAAAIARAQSMVPYESPLARRVATHVDTIDVEEEDEVVEMVDPPSTSIPAAGGTRAEADRDATVVNSDNDDDDDIVEEDFSIISPFSPPSSLQNKKKGKRKAATADADLVESGPSGGPWP